MLLGLVFAGWLCTPSVSDEPYRVLKESGADFLGPGRGDPDPEGLTTVRLGVIGPERRPEGQSLRRGVDLAVSEANANAPGGYRGKPFEVVFRADDGPWGMGAKQVAALAYEDSVWAVIGSLNGGDAHLAELVAAKLWVPVLSPTASDHTIDYANVPWVFRAFPSDTEQAALLVRYATGVGRLLLALVEDDREGRTGLRRLEGAISRAPGFDLAGRPFKAHTPGAAVQPGDLQGADAVVVWASPAATRVMVETLRALGYNGPVLLPSCALSEQVLSRADLVGELVVAAPFDFGVPDTAYTGFRQRYRAAYAADPDPIAAFAYDTTRLTLSAIQRAGLNRARIRDALTRTDFKGVVGRHAFDALGGSLLQPVLLRRDSKTWNRLPAP